jgi:alpha-glucosidase
MILYQVYPRSFSDSNSDGLGDLRGLLGRLPYLASLGIEMVWISPFVKSPMKDFGYDVSDYCAVDSIFGTMEDFEEIVQKAASLKIEVMIDMVLSHTSNEHSWFRESRVSRNSEKSNWYVWADAKSDGSAPNNWMSLFGGSAWQWDESRGQFYLHNFLREQPDLNFHEAAVQEELLKACEFWLEKGVRGFRLDVCNFFFHDKSLRDNPARDLNDPGQTKTDGVHAGNPYNFQLHLYDKDQPENLVFLKRLRDLVDRYHGSVLMGEVVSDNSLKIMSDYISNSGPLNTAYSFALFQDAFNGKALEKTLTEVESRLSEGIPTWALGNHDVPRFMSRFHAEIGFPESAKCYLSFLFALRGHVILYQGDELGLDEAEIPRELMQDPFGIEFYPEFKGRDGCRTPMPWASVRPRGQTWLPIPKSHLAKSVERQEDDTSSVLAYTKELIAWRKARPWLVTAPLKVLFSNDHVLVMERPMPTGKSFYIAVNGGPEAQSINLSDRILSLDSFAVCKWEV